MKSNKLNRSLISVLIASSLFVSAANADGYMNCSAAAEDLLDIKVDRYRQTFEQMVVEYILFFQWGYRSADGAGEKGMFTNFGMKDFAFGGDPSTPTSMTVEYPEADQTLLFKRIDDAAWGGANMKWQVKRLNHKTNISKNISVSCDEFTKTPNKANLNRPSDKKR